MWAGASRRARMPPWTAGWSVLTRPSRIPGAPVTVATSITVEPGVAQQAGGAAGRDQLDAEAGELARELDQPRLVRDREQGAPGRPIGHAAAPSRVRLPW